MTAGEQLRVSLAVLVLGVLLAVAVGRASGDSAAPAPPGGPVLPELGPAPALTELPSAVVEAARLNVEARRGRWTAELRRPALLRATPAGRRLARVSARTGYGARRIFAVGAVRPGWIGVRTVQRPSGKLAWVPEEAVRLRSIRTMLVADLSERELTVRIDGGVRHRAPIGIGRPGSETPLGRYGVTDRLAATGGLGAVYGCCMVQLTGHQPKLPAGWVGGTRLALHGTPTPGSVGREVSAGCLRMRDADIRRILPAVPLGATLVVRA